MGWSRLVGEENELLQEAEAGRKEAHRERLHAITQELDRAWETLRPRAERRAKPGCQLPGRLLNPGSVDAR